VRSPSCPLRPSFIPAALPPGAEAPGGALKIGQKRGAAGEPDRPDGRMATHRPEAAGDRTARHHAPVHTPGLIFSVKPRIPVTFRTISPSPVGEARRVFPPEPSLPDLPGEDEREDRAAKVAVLVGSRARLRETEREPPKSVGSRFQPTILRQLQKQARYHGNG